MQEATGYPEEEEPLMGVSPESNEEEEDSNTNGASDHPPDGMPCIIRITHQLKRLHGIKSIHFLEQKSLQD